MKTNTIPTGSKFSIDLAYSPLHFVIGFITKRNLKKSLQNKLHPFPEAIISDKYVARIGNKKVKYLVVCLSSEFSLKESIYEKFGTIRKTIVSVAPKHYYTLQLNQVVTLEVKREYETPFTCPVTGEKQKLFDYKIVTL